MKLLIISDMAHYSQGQQIVGWGPTVQEINALSQIFEEIVHIGCLFSGPAPLSSLPYLSDKIKFIPLVPSGGDSVGAKINILKHIPGYIKTIGKWLPWADMVHVRCPANIPLITLIMLIFIKEPKYRWVKYAGNWRPLGKEAWSYTLQRWILQKNLHRGAVTVNGRWEDQPQHIYSFFNPCLTREECANGRGISNHKELAPPYRLLFVGRLETAKGVNRVLEICAKLNIRELPFQLDLVGDGPEKKYFEQLAVDLQIGEKTHFHGWLPRSVLNQYYSNAHFIIFPSSASEGWPKVLSEAMAYGTVPIASNISSIPQILSDTQSGYAFAPEEIDRFVQIVLDFSQDPASWKVMSQAAVAATDNFTYDHYLGLINSMLLSIKKELFYDRK